MEEFNPKRAAQAQDDYCDARLVPRFAPENGVCGHCGRNIYGRGGYGIAEAGRRHIVNCPHCHRLFCE